MLYAHALHFFCIFTMFHAFRCVFYVGTLCVGRFGLGWALDEIFVTCHMIMHYSCIRSFHFLFVTFCWLVLFCLSSFLFLSFLDILCMAPKHKTTTSRNPFHFKASSFDSTPFHVRFRDEKARQDFSENFSKRGIHSECRVILSDFSDTTLPTVIHSWGWQSLYDIPVSCPTMIIKEFYSNTSIPLYLGTFIPRFIT